MTKSLLTIALAAATLPLSFAAPQASTPAPANTNQATTQKPKKHVKKSHKKTTPANNAAPAKPASK